MQNLCPVLPYKLQVPGASRDPVIGLRRFFLLGLLVGLASQTAQAQELGQARILSPTAGSSLSGEVAVIGSATHPTFVRYELAFAYDPDPTETWFTIRQSVVPLVEGELGRWNTTGIADGVYALRLRVYLSERNSIETIVRGLRVNNTRATATPTATPQATATPTPTPSITPTAILLLTATPAVGAGPGSPAAGVGLLVTPGDPLRIEAAFWEGVQLAIRIFGILGLYVLIQAIWSRRRRRTSR
jgi:hypothetical protein